MDMENVRAHCGDVDLVDGSPGYRFTTSGLLSLLIDATSATASPELVEQAIDVFPFLLDVLSVEATAASVAKHIHDATVARAERVLRSYEMVRQKDVRLVEEEKLNPRELKAKFAGPENAQLLCFVLFRFAKYFFWAGMRAKALFFCADALEFISDCADVQHLELAIKLLRIRISDYKEEPDWPSLNQELRRTDDRAVSDLLLTGFLRESGHLNNQMLDSKTAEGSLTGALTHGEGNVAKQATIRLTLVVYLYARRYSRPIDRNACLTLLEQAIAGFKQVHECECKCKQGPLIMATDYYDELFGVMECPCHQLLADAFLYQGIIQRKQGLNNEAYASFEEGWDILKRHNCIDENREFFFQFNLALPKTCQDVSECSTSSGHVRSSGVPTSSLLQLLIRAVPDSDDYRNEVNVGLEAYPELSKILATKRRALAKSCCKRHGEFEITSRCLLTVACDASRTNGDDETMARCLEEVVRDVEVMHTEHSDGNDPGLLGFLLFRCAKILCRLGRTTQARRACNFALQIIADHPGAIHLRQAILFLQDNQRSDVKIVSLDVKTSINRKDTEDCDRAKLESLLTGIFRKGPSNLHPAFDSQMVEDILNAALKREEESNFSDAAKLATIRLTLAQYQLEQRRLASSQEICLGLLKRAITEFKQVDSKCCRYYMRAGYEDELFGGTECPCHRLLGDALLSQALVLKDRGATAEALQSCVEGKKLLEHSNRDEDLQLKFSSLSFFLKQDSDPRSFNYGQKFLLDILSGRSVKDFPGRRDGDEVLRLAVRCGMIDQGTVDALLLRIENEEYDPEAAEAEAVEARLLQKLSEPHSSLELAGQLLTICHWYWYVKKDISTTKDYFNRAVQAMKDAASDYESTASGYESTFFDRDRYMRYLMTMGQWALTPKTVDLDHAYYLWSQVYKVSEEKLEDLAEISEDHAIRYFEQTKHACMALAKCEFLKLRGNLSQTDFYKCLLWAERGMGRMLSLSNIKDFKAIALDSRISGWGFSGHYHRLDPSVSESKLVADETHFRKDDDFARDYMILCSRHSGKKCVFIEYTFLDQNQFLISLVSDGLVMHYAQGDLSKILDDDTKRDAEEELFSLAEWCSSSRASSSNTKEPSSSRSSDKLKEFCSESEIPWWLNEYEVNRAPFNPWIPGMAVGIQRRAAAAQKMRIEDPAQLRKEEEKICGLLQKLYAILIKPIREALNKLLATDSAGLWTLVFVPHEDLGVVPFAALHEKDGSPYLIEEYAMSVSPAIWVSRLLQLTYEDKVERETKDFLLVGRKSGYPESWPDLNEAHKEVNAVAQALKPMVSCKMLVDETDPDIQALTKDEVMKYLPHASWIHLSVHGEISSEFPQGSLLLGGSDSERLTAADIIRSGNGRIIGHQHSKWAARCAIASACQSGLGAVGGGGIMGFARAFILAGVPSCVLSLWKVNEAFSTKFMDNLYTELGKPGKTLGDAMQSTITSMLKETTTRRRTLNERRTPNSATKPRWSILDWAAYSCFGFPGVQLPHNDYLTAKPRSSSN